MHSTYLPKYSSICKKRTFSIVLPVFNRADIVSGTLDSIFNQTYRPLDLIIVDNNSSDNTINVIEEWKSLHESDDFKISILLEKRKGASISRNRGLDNVDSEWMLFFDSDDLMKDNLVESIMSEAFNNPSADLIYWRAAYLNQNNRFVKKHFTSDNLLRYHLIHCSLSTQSFAIKTSFIKKCGGWHNDLKCWNDYELGLRILLNNPSCISIPELLVYVYPQKESITGTDFSSKAGEWEKALEIMEHYTDIYNPDTRELIKRLIIYRKINLAAIYRKEGNKQLANTLFRKTFHSYILNPGRKVLLILIYYITSKGIRGAHLLWR